MGLFSSKKIKSKESKGTEIKIEPEIKAGLMEELKSKGKDVVRFEVVDFG